MKRSLLYGAFNGGEWDPRLHGRADLAAYPGSVAMMRNMLPMSLGGACRRPGTYDLGPTRENSPATLLRFSFSDTQAYALEMSAAHIRLWVHDGQVLEAADGPPLDIACPYGADQVEAVQTAQSADVLYMAHPAHACRMLRREGAVDWDLETLATRDGPYRDPWPGMPAMTLLGTTCTFALAVASSDWVGQCIRLKLDGKWYWKRVVAVASPTSITAITEPGVAAPGLIGQTNASFTVTVLADGSNGEFFTLPAGWGSIAAPDNVLVTVNNLTLTASLHYVLTGGGTQVRLTPPALPNVTVTIVNMLLAADPGEVQTGYVTDWRAPAWGGSRGFPRTVTFHQDRLVFAGSPAAPLSIWFSRTGDYDNFAPTEQDGEVLDDNAITVSIQDEAANPILWLCPAAGALTAGTSSASHIILASQLGEALTPANRTTRPASDTGAAAIRPIRIDGAVLYVRNDRRAVQELVYRVDADGDGYVAPDLSQLAAHLLRSRIRAMAWQATPWRALWCVLDNGRLASLVYLRDQKVVAWSQHRMGGGGKVLAATCLPGAEGDELYLVVERVIGGTVTRRVERLADAFDAELDEDGEPVAWGAIAAYFVDAGLTYRGPARTSFAGLDHLEGQTVSVLADGIVLPPRTVSGGTITLTRPASVVHAGLACPYRLETLDLDGGSDTGTGQNRAKLVTNPSVRFHASLNAWLGTKGGTPEQIPSRRDGSRMDAPAILYSGWQDRKFGAGWDKAMRLVIHGDDPLPCMVTAVTLGLTTNG